MSVAYEPRTRYAAIPLPTDASGGGRDDLLLADPRFLSAECDMTLQEVFALRYLAALCLRAEASDRGPALISELHQLLVAVPRSEVVECLTEATRGDVSLTSPDVASCTQLTAELLLSSCAATQQRSSSDRPAYLFAAAEKLRPLLVQLEASVGAPLMTAAGLLARDRFFATGLAAFDTAVLKGGLRPGLLVEVGGPSGCAKSRLVEQWAARIATDGEDVVIISSTVRHAPNLQRFVETLRCCAGPSEMSAASHRVRFIDSVTCLRGLLQSEAALRRTLVASCEYGGRRCALLIVDSLAHLIDSTDFGHGEDRTPLSARRSQLLVRVAGMLKRIAEDLGCAVVIVNGEVPKATSATNESLLGAPDEDGGGVDAIMNRSEVVGLAVYHAVNVRLILDRRPPFGLVLRCVKSPLSVNATFLVDETSGPLLTVAHVTAPDQLALMAAAEPPAGGGYLNGLPVPGLDFDHVTRIANLLAATPHHNR